MTYTRDQLDEIKKQAGIRPYEKRLKLQQNGAEYRGYCPWHEKDGVHNPSLAVFKDKNLAGAWNFACMSRCGKRKGDVFAFIQFQDNVTFGEAVRLAAGDGGVTQADAAPRGIQKPSPEQFEQARQYLADNGIPIEFAKSYTKLDAVVHPKLGLALAFPYDSDDEVVKYRAIAPKDKSLKFSHASGHPSEMLLYNVKHAEKEIDRDSIFSLGLFVVESERDCLTMEAHGFTAVSVSSASTCVDSAGNLKILDEHVKIIANVEDVFVATDQDPVGEQCGQAFERDEAFNKNQVKRISWPYAGKRSDDPKDIGELYLQDPAGFRERILELADEARRRPPRWRQQFKTPAEMDDGEVIQLVEGFMTEGNIGLGGLSGHGKTFVALSLTKALTTGRAFVGQFKVPVIRPVLYLCPEVGERQLRKRIGYFGIPPNDEDLFLCRTLTQGVTLPLDHPHVLDAIRNMGNPVVVLDTAIRFSTADDENSAAANSWMEKAVRGLREAGAIAVILLHHSPKSASKEKAGFIPTLENTFRGTGDIGALLDVGYNVRIDDSAPGLQIKITNVKPRDFDPPLPFNLGLKMTEKDAEGRFRSFLVETGDLALMAPEETAPATTRPVSTEVAVERLFETSVTTNPTASFNEIAEIMNRSKSQVQKLAKKLGWIKRGDKWEKVVQPFLAWDKSETVLLRPETVS